MGCCESKRQVRPIQSEHEERTQSAQRRNEPRKDEADEKVQNEPEREQTGRVMSQAYVPEKDSASVLRCSNHHKIVFICINQECQNSALFCSERTCPSGLDQHRECKSVDLLHISQRIEQRSRMHDKIVERMDQLQNKYMVEISEKRKDSFQTAFAQRRDEKTSAIIQRVYYNNGENIDLKGKEAYQFVVKLQKSTKHMKEYQDDCVEKYEYELKQLAYKLSDVQNETINNYAQRCRIRMNQKYDFNEGVKKEEENGQESRRNEEYVEEPKNNQSYGQQSRRNQGYVQQSRKSEGYGQQSRRSEGYGQESRRNQQNAEQQRRFYGYYPEKQNQNIVDESRKNEGEESRRNQGYEEERKDPYGQESRKYEVYGGESRKDEIYNEKQKNNEYYDEESRKNDFSGEASKANEYNYENSKRNEFQGQASRGNEVEYEYSKRKESEQKINEINSQEYKMQQSNTITFNVEESKRNEYVAEESKVNQYDGYDNKDRNRGEVSNIEENRVSGQRVERSQVERGNGYKNSNFRAKQNSLKKRNESSLGNQKFRSKIFLQASGLGGDRSRSKINPTSSVILEQRNVISTFDSCIVTRDMKSERFFIADSLKNPRKIQLLFRASKHYFESERFHEYCDEVQNTMTIIKTEYNKMVVGFTPLAWNKTHGIRADPTGSTFLLSLDLKEKMTLVNSQKAIQCLPSHGPVFGNADIAISDQCNEREESMTNFASSFNNDDIYQNDQLARSSLCGVRDGRHFRVLEYEVFKVIW